MAANIKILMVDDHAIVREGLKYMLSQVPHMEVTAEATRVLKHLSYLRLLTST